MAKFVIAGKSNCPHFAKAELLADAMAKNLPNFTVFKQVVDPDKWDEWLEKICIQNNWIHSRSPIIWRELVYRGGKPLLVGDSNDFLQFVKHFYGTLDSISHLTSFDLRKISAENEITFKLIEDENKQIASKIRPFIVTITNPVSQVVYYFINEMLDGSVFGKTTEIEVRLYCNFKQPDLVRSLKGLKMEIEDLASPLLRRVKIATDGEEAFSSCDFAILLDHLDEFIQDPNEPQKKTCPNPYLKLAEEIDQYAKSTCKILVTPHALRSEIYLFTNTLSKRLKRIDARKQVMGNSMCDTMAIKSILAGRLKVDPADIRNILFIGQSLEASFYVDLTLGEVTNHDGAIWAPPNIHWRNLVYLVADRDWIKRDFINLVRERESQIREKLKRDQFLTFAQSVVEICRLWSSQGSDDCYSAIVNPNGNFSIKEDVFLSVPIRFQNGSFKLANDIKLQSFVEDMINDTKERMEKRFLDDMVVEDLEFKPSFNRVKYE